MGHDALHDVGHARHVSAVLQQSQAEEKYQYVRQEGHYRAHARDDAVHDQRGYHRTCVHRRQAVRDRAAQPVYQQLQPALQPVAQRERQQEGQRHDAQEHGYAPDLAGQYGVRLLGQHVLALLVQQHLAYYLAYEVVLLVYDVRLVAAVERLRQVHRVLFAYLLVRLQQLYGVPAIIWQVRVAPLQLGDDLVYLVFYLVGVDHRELAVVVVGMVRDLRVLVYQPVRRRLVLVVYRRVHQHVQAAALARRHRHHRDAQHLREAVQVYLHAALFHDVHHVQRHDHRLAQLQQLQGEVEAALQRAGVHDVYNDVHLVAEYEAPGDRLLHRVGGKRVGARQVDQVYALPLELYLSFHLLYRDARPVGHLEVGAGVGVEQRGLAAVGVADEPYRHVTRHCSPPPSPVCCA